LKNSGISVFRSIGSSAITSLVAIFNDATEGLPAITRASGREKEHAVTLVQLIEVQKNREYFGSLCISDVVNTVYNEVPSLRKKVKVEIQKDNSVKILSNRNKIQRPISVVLDPKYEAILKAERREILSVIEDLTCYDHQEFEWLLDPTPHLSLGKILLKEVAPERIRSVISDIETQLPEEITLNRATIHTSLIN
jgi:hypothetical protein